MPDPTPPRGIALLQDPARNRGTAFTDAERDALGLRGLLPPRVFTPEEQRQRILANFARKTTNLDKYIFLTGLQDRNERAFYQTIITNLEAMLPIIYTPTVGEACQQFAHIFRRPRGMYVCYEDRGRIADVLRNWPTRDVAVIVVTDGERILGLGDLGANGMGIPVGKLSLYTACAGIDPAQCLPVMLDVGTGNAELRDDELYFGLQRPRVRGDAYDDFVDEFVEAVQTVFPRALVQFEDFATPNAVRLLARYRDRTCAFNDDIQGTAAVTLAGLLASARITGVPLADQRLVFVGAGSAATGIADLIVTALQREGVSEDDARKRCWFVDSHGLVVAGRGELAPHKRPYAHDHQTLTALDAIVDAVRPTALIGVSGQPRAFTEAAIRRMAAINERPVVFALSNPTSRAECTAEQAYAWTDGRAVFASGSPFPPVTIGDHTFRPGQGNNAYVFPGVGLGVVVSGARRVTDEMFLAAARVLADLIGEDDIQAGAVYPPLGTIRDVSARIGSAVVSIARDRGLATVEIPPDLDAFVRGQMYDARYD